MAQRQKKETRITVSLEADDYRDLEDIARRSDVSIAWVIRRSIGEFLNQHRGKTFGQLPLKLDEEKAT
jgi:predicted DNA-binding ribbon-helix-helix protein